MYHGILTKRKIKNIQKIWIYLMIYNCKFCQNICCCCLFDITSNSVVKFSRTFKYCDLLGHVWFAVVNVSNNRILYNAAFCNRSIPVYR